MSSKMSRKLSSKLTTTENSPPGAPLSAFSLAGISGDKEKESQEKEKEKEKEKATPPSGEGVVEATGDIYLEILLLRVRCPYCIWRSFVCF